MKVSCTTCEAPINRSPSHVKEKNFCNHSCYAKFKSEMWKKGKNPQYKGGNLKLECEQCGKEFTTRRNGHERKVCSRACYAKRRSELYIKSNHPMWEGIETRTTKEVRSLKKFEDWRKQVLKRDNYTCKQCGAEEKLHVHHIVPLADMVKYHKKLGIYDARNELYFRPENGVTLCSKCHYQQHSKSDELLGLPQGQSAAKLGVHS